MFLLERHVAVIQVFTNRGSQAKFCNVKLQKGIWGGSRVNDGYMRIYKCVIFTIAHSKRERKKKGIVLEVLYWITEREWKQLTMFTFSDDVPGFPNELLQLSTRPLAHPARLIQVQI